jgi:hypothetical protein
MTMGSFIVIRTSRYPNEESFLLFEKGEETVDGCGNHFVKIAMTDHTYLLGFLDSHNDRIDQVDGKDVWSYDTSNHRRLMIV